MSRTSSHEASCSESGADGLTSGTVEQETSHRERAANAVSLDKAFISVCPMSVTMPALLKRRRSAWDRLDSDWT